MILIQAKGGNATWPTAEDIQRLRKVARHYKAKAVLLAEWKRGSMPRIYRLKKMVHPKAHPYEAWIEVDALKEFLR